MKSPYCKVYVNGDPRKDITEHVDRVEYEDTIKKDPKLTISVFNDGQNDRVGYLLDREDINSGSFISVRFGMMEGKMSETHTLEIKNIKTSYTTSGIKLTLTCLGEGNTSKKATNSKIWKKATTGSIITSIAKSHGLTAVIDKGLKMAYDSLPQGNRSDMDLLKYLAEREDDGNYVIYIRNKKLHFVKRGLETVSQRTFTWGVDIKAFEAERKEATGKEDGEATEVINVDAASKESLNSLASPTTEKSSTTLGDYKSTYHTQFNDVAERVKKILVTPDKKTESVNVANSNKKENNLKLLEGTLIVELEPSMQPNMPITVAGVHRRYRGNWLVDKVVHKIDDSGASTTMGLQKNGSKEGKVKADAKNNTVGPDSKKTKVKVAVFDSNAKLLGRKTKDVKRTK